jgi:uncharacterized phiE125 gp8 family phage protein
MDLTTVTRVKAHLEEGESFPPAGAAETLLTALVGLYSALVETRLGRLALTTARTTQLDVLPRQARFSLPAYPVTSVTSVHHDVLRGFDATTLLDTDDYYCELASGILTVEYPLLPGDGVLKVVYTGGMAATTAAFVVAYPELAAAVDLAVVAHYQRRKALGAHGLNAGAGSLSFSGALELPPEVVRIVESYRRVAMA